MDKFTKEEVITLMADPDWMLMDLASKLKYLKNATVRALESPEAKNDPTVKEFYATSGHTLMEQTVEKQKRIAILRYCMSGLEQKDPVTYKIINDHYVLGFKWAKTAEMNFYKAQSGDHDWPHGREIGKATIAQIMEEANTYVNNPAFSWPNGPGANDLSQGNAFDKIMDYIKDFDDLLEENRVQETEPEIASAAR